MTTLNKYLVYCITEGGTVPTDYVASVPTVCPHNNTDTIDPTQTIIIDTIGPSLVSINQDSQYPNGGYFRVNSYQMGISGGTGTVTTMNISYAYNIDCYSTTFLPTSDNVGDSVQAISLPNTPVGLITAAIGTGTTGLNSPSATLLNPGFLLFVTDGVNTDSLGEITSLNMITGDIFFMTPTVNSYGTGAEILISVERVRSLTFANTNKLEFGLTRISSAGLPAGGVLQMNYTNNSGNAKVFNFLAEISY